MIRVKSKGHPEGCPFYPINKCYINSQRLIAMTAIPATSP